MELNLVECTTKCILRIITPFLLSFQFWMSNVSLLLIIQDVIC